MKGKMAGVTASLEIYIFVVGCSLRSKIAWGFRHARKILKMIVFLSTLAFVIAGPFIIFRGFMELHLGIIYEFACAIIAILSFKFMKKLEDLNVEDILVEKKGITNVPI